jgi:hypothetical protein
VTGTCASQLPPLQCVAIQTHLSYNHRGRAALVSQGPIPSRQLLFRLRSRDTVADMNHHTLSLKHWGALARHHPSAFLLAAQLLSLVLYAVFDRSSSGRELLGAFGVLVLLLAFWVINRRATIRWIAWTLVAPALVLSLLCLLVNTPTLSAWSSLLKAALYFYAAGSLIVYMMGDYRVTADELFAAGATFTLLAWAFAYAYLVCQTWFPDSFVGATYPGQPRTFLELLSLSFTNLTATGLGDVLPMTPPARVLVMLEQFAGIAYVAMVVSRLIGMTIGRQKK